MLDHKYSGLNQAISKVDADGVASWLKSNAASDFFLRSTPSKTVDTKESVAMLRGQYLVLQKTTASSYTLSNLSVHSDHLSVGVKFHTVQITKGSKKLVTDTRAIHTWRKEGGGWKLASIVNTRVRVVFDGKTAGFG